MKKNIYVLGTGLSHDGSACLLKDGKIRVAIEKERITRIKHDGGNDLPAIEYCLKAEGITIHDVDLIVQNANFGSFKFGNDFYRGVRPFNDSMGIPVVTISHHLAHAYSAIGTCPFDDCNVLVMDGCGNSFDDCIDLSGSVIPDLGKINILPHLYHEKDSYYRFADNTYTSLIKDFSEWGHELKNYPLYPQATKHSIGGLYKAVSLYCFGNTDDPGKLMGLGPYGKAGTIKEEVFDLKDGRVFVNYDWMEKHRNPARSYEVFKKNFQYYADIAYGIQREVERAILYIVKSRLEAYPAGNICYAGGTALNAVANARILSTMTSIKQLYIEPAAGDNGLSLGCAFYGWLEVLKNEKFKHNGSTCFGITYSIAEIKNEIDSFDKSQDPVKMKKTMDLFFTALNKDKAITTGAKINIQFNIEQYGIFQVLINDAIKSENQILDRPTCMVNIDGNDFYQALLSPGSLRKLLSSGRVKVSNFTDLELLFRNIDFEDFARLLKEQKDKGTFEETRKFSYKYSEEFIRQTAELLAQGNVIGWFQSGCEFGPRSLGRRSILADPRNPGVRDFINSQIKFREDFRPFAPSVLREDASLYFQTDRDSPYMILVDLVQDEYRDKIRSVVHEDRTSRTQTVTPDWNNKYYQLLKEFKKITGISVLLNTSFNRRGMPIVETPRDAIDFFFSCKLDYLVMDKFIIGKGQSGVLPVQNSDVKRTTIQVS